MGQVAHAVRSESTHATRCPDPDPGGAWRGALLAPPSGTATIVPADAPRARHGTARVGSPVSCMAAVHMTLVACVVSVSVVVVEVVAGAVVVVVVRVLVFVVGLW